MHESIAAVHDRQAEHNKIKHRNPKKKKIEARAE
jgi:hypothetical protein